MAEARSQVLAKLGPVVGDLEPRGDRASPFGFLLTGAGEPASEDALCQVAVSVAHAVGRSLGLSIADLAHRLSDDGVAEVRKALAPITEPRATGLKGPTPPARQLRTCAQGNQSSFSGGPPLPHPNNSSTVRE